jgi:autotransporter-associated beta strand protein
MLAGGDPIFDVQSSANATTTLTLGTLTDQAIAPRSITFQNSSAHASVVTLGLAATSLVNGTLVNIASVGGAVTLNLNNATALGTVAQVTLASGNTLSLGASQTLLSLNGGGTVTASTNAVMTIGNPLSPLVSHSVFDGVLAGGSSLSLVKAGRSSLTLGGAISNTYSGSAATVVTEGTLILAKTGGAVAIPGNLTLDAFGSATGAAAVRLAGHQQIVSTAALTMRNGATFDLNGFNQNLASIGGNDAATIINQASSTASTLTVGSHDASSTFLGRIVDGPGALALVKTGTGTLTLSGANSHSGTTTVQAGTIQVGVGGSGQTGTGAVSMDPGSTLLGTGFVQGSSFTAANGSSIHAGDTTAQNSYGTLHFTPVSGSGTLDFQTGSTLFLGINPGGISDLLNIVGTGTSSLLFNGSLTVTANAFTPMAEETFNLIDWSGLASTPTFASHYNATGTFFGNNDEVAGIDLPNIFGSGFAWDMSSFITNGSISIVSVVPEPSRILLFSLAFVMLFMKRRR